MQVMQETFISLWLKKQTKARQTIFGMNDCFLQNQHKPLKANNLIRNCSKKEILQITVFAVTVVVEQNHKLR